MAKIDSINPKKGVLSGNNVSHSNRKTRRRFLPNMQNFSLISEALGGFVTLRMTTNSVRSVEHNHGIDAYLLSKPNSKLAPEARVLKKRIIKAIAKKEAATAA
ncbi:MAG: 50S ribosomal protein L28 [Candidatus Lariskella arthropodorum]|uniref:50S ribosomal protein L28 n=1 Tax=Candidatus Lariskella endosymbiont of Epinotia ramella TaxID=3066224 RepID=UPI0030CA9AAA